jgi:hypothetical protein
MAATFVARLAVNLSAIIKPLSTTAALKSRRKIKTKREMDHHILKIKYVKTNKEKNDYSRRRLISSL